MSRSTFAALASLPALFFVVYLAIAMHRGKAADSLWICHVSNLLLALGLITQRRSIVGVAVAWIILGIPLWALDAWHSGEVTPVSAVSHLGGLALGLYALSRLRISYNPWLAALLLFVAIQQLCRWVTPVALNVNLAHAAYAGWEDRFGGYWAYWFLTTAAAAAALWLIGRMLTIWFKGEAPCR